MSNNQPNAIHLQNIQQLRELLATISHQNIPLYQDSFSSSFQLQNIIQDYQNFKECLEFMIEELNKKSDTINNLVDFSFSLLNEVQKKASEVLNSKLQLDEQQEKINQILLQNQKILTRLNEIQQENQDYKVKMEEAETYISEISQQKSQLQFVHITKKQMKHYICQPIYNDSRSERFMAQNQQTQSKFQTLIKAKDTEILYLQTEISKMQKHFALLEKELQMKKSEIQLSQIFYKEKISKLNQNLQKSLQNSLNPHQISYLPEQSLFKEQSLSRVQSASSILYQPQQVPSNKNIDANNDQTNINQPILRVYDRNGALRKSLKQEIYSFCLQTEKYFQQSNQQTYCTLQIRSTGVGTQSVDNISRGVQADGKRIIKRKTTNLRPILEDVRKQTMNLKSQQISKDNNILRSIYDFAFKKIVVSRIKSK